MDTYTLAKSVVQTCLTPSQGRLYGDRDRLIRSISDALRSARSTGQREGAEAMQVACLQIIDKMLGRERNPAISRCREAIVAILPEDLLRPELDEGA